MRRSMMLAWLAASLVPAWGQTARGFEGKAWALVVGVGEYPLAGEHKKIDCPNAVEDAKAVASWLTNKAEWPADRVRLMTSSEVLNPRLRPTLANLKDAFSEWLKKKVQPGDLIFIYFAGQVLSNPDSDRRDLLDQPHDLLLPVDFDFGKVDQTGWALDRELRQFFAANVQVFCCLDTSTAGREIQMTPEVTPANRLLGALVPRTDWAAWIAADNGLPSPDNCRDGQGSPLRHRMLEALGTTQSRNNMSACLKAIREDQELGRINFSTRGQLRADLTLWSGRVETVKDAGIRPVLQRGHAGPITGLLARVDGETFVSSSGDSTVRFWRAGVGSRPVLDRTLPDPIGGVSCLALSPDGRWIAAASGTRDDVWLWGADGENFPLEPKELRRRSTRPIRSIGFLPGSRWFITLNHAGEVLAWDVRTRRPKVVMGGASVDGESGIAFATTAAGPDPTVAALLVRGAEGRVNVKLLGADIEQRRSLPGLGSNTSAVDLSGDGRSLALGNESGESAIYDLSKPDAPGNGPIAPKPLPGEKVERLRLKGGWLAIGTDRGLRLFDAPKGRFALEVAADEVRRIVFSDDGRLLAAIVLDDEGLRARLWRLGVDGKVSEIALGDGDGPADSPRELAFAGQGLELIAGGQKGSIRSWKLDREKTRVVSAPGLVPPDPSQIKSISPSPDGKRFIRLHDDGMAFLFDFDARASTPLEHRWNALDFLPDGRLVGIVSDRDTKLQGNERTLALGAPVEYYLKRKPGSGNVLGFGPSPIGDIKPPNLKLDRMSASADGKRVGLARGQGAYPQGAFVWELPNGKPRSLEVKNGLDRLVGFALSPTGNGVVVCTGKEANLYEGDESRSSLKPVDGDEFSAVAFAPKRAGAKDALPLIALGTRKSGVVLWSPGAGNGGEVRQLPGEFDIEVRSLAFVSSDDGTWLVASGEDKRFTAWERKPGGRFEEVTFQPARPRHDAEIRDIKPWPRLSMVATTGDDGTVRFWSLKERQLIGTIAFTRGGLNEQAGFNWVAYSPDGRFDCPTEARGFLKLVRDGTPIGVDQAVARLFDSRLTEEILEARVVPPPRIEKTPPPRVALKRLSPLKPDGTSPNQAVLLELLLDAPGPTDLRLYRNDIPTRGADQFQRVEGDPTRYRALVTLRKGDNTFRAIAARDDAIEGSSTLEPIRYEGNEVASRVHVLAIGIDKYSRADLKLDYAVRDARDLSQRLTDLDTQVNGRPEEPPILLRVDDQVDEDEVKRAFRRLREQVDGRPGDKVVVFLAGHTDNYGDEFGLLLSKKRDGASSILKYSTILQGLAQLDAEQRLVIVDACLTEKIQSGEEALQFARSELRAIERHTLSYPTQYILASKGLENRELGHGLLTYTLLRGLGQDLNDIPPKLRNDPKATASFSKPADEDDDGKVTTDELNRYASTRLPILLAAYENSPQVARGKPEEVEKDREARRQADRPRFGADPVLAPFDLVSLRGPAR